MELRRAELAGAWYPNQKSECQRIFEGFEADAVDARAGAPLSPNRQGPLRAGIVPHAGWVFSGSIAYDVLRELAELAAPPETVALFAGHLHPRSPATLLERGACETPLGPLPVDEPLAAALAARFPALHLESPQRHSQDNSAEVVFPLIKHFFPDAHLLVLGAPPNTLSLRLADALLAAAAELSRTMVFVGSTDLTHYGPNYRFTPKGIGPEAEAWVRETNDRAFLQRALAAETTTLLDEALASHNACCPGAAAAAIHCARAAGANAGRELRYSTSADRRPASSFVGYGGVVL
ncbi:MAG: AmmeMemoRadiSam system protein B [Proteobacteria bacterium]|nr:MAG: AmmeMemoRadiSam system protein B [Pseudomonadota bacterium]PIE17636.1 MAG: AmmeMemoRadiSam system protein B [Pseudomonadota bacterium]